MTDHFLDSSALVKRYFLEPGSTWVRSIAVPSPPDALLIVEIARVEVAATIAAKYRASRHMSVQQRDAVLALFLDDCTRHFSISQLNSTMIDRAIELTQRHRLRGYDAVQLAAALVANVTLAIAGKPSLVFVSADADLLAAARAEGLAVENPLHYTHLDPTP